MAHGYVQIGSRFEDIVVAAGQNINSGDDIYAGFVGAAAANYATIGGMRARLLAIGGAFVAAYVDQLSVNDMEYALKISGG